MIEQTSWEEAVNSKDAKTERAVAVKGKNWRVGGRLSSASSTNLDEDVNLREYSCAELMEVSVRPRTTSIRAAA